MKFVNLSLRIALLVLLAGCAPKSHRGGVYDDSTQATTPFSGPTAGGGGTVLPSSRVMEPGRQTGTSAKFSLVGRVEQSSQTVSSAHYSIQGSVGSY